MEKYVIRIPHPHPHPHLINFWLCIKDDDTFDSGEIFGLDLLQRQPLRLRYDEEDEDNSYDSNDTKYEKHVSSSQQLLQSSLVNFFICVPSHVQ